MQKISSKRPTKKAVHNCLVGVLSPHQVIILASKPTQLYVISIIVGLTNIYYAFLLFKLGKFPIIACQQPRINKTYIVKYICTHYNYPYELLKEVSYMSTENNNTSDWTAEDCQNYINLLYPNRTSSFKERKANAFFNSKNKKNRKTTITNDGIYVDGKLFLPPANIKKCVSSGNLYFFERKDSMLLRCVKADGEKLQSMNDFLSVNNIDFSSDSPDDIYRLRLDAKLYKKSRKPVLIIATIIFLISMSGINVNKNVPFYASDIIKDAGLSSAVSGRYMDTVIDTLPSSEQAGMEVSEYNKLLSDIQNAIQNSSAIDSIARKYTDALTKGLCDGKAFDEINIDIDEELTTLAAIAYNGITQNQDYSDDIKNVITLSLVLDKQSAQKAINNYASGIYDEMQYRASGLAGIYQTISSKTFYAAMILLLALSLILLILFSLPLSVIRIYLPALFVIYAGLEYVTFNVLLSRAAMLLSNRILGRTASLNLTYANADLISYVSLGILLAIIINIAYRKMKRKAEKRI